MLVSRRLLFVRALPFLQIPNLKAAASTDQRDLALQAELFAGILRKNEAAVPIGSAVLGARV
jgi:hypothetical protein